MGPLQLMHDGPSQFKNRTSRLLPNELRVPHYTTVLYPPQRNGGVEQGKQHFLLVIRAVLFKVRRERWERIVLLRFVQSAIIIASSPQRDSITLTLAITRSGA